MNKQRIFSLQLLLCAALGLHQTQAFVFDTLPGDATAMAIHKKTGTVVVGSTNAEAGGPIVYYIGPASGTDTETLTAVADGGNAGDLCVAGTLAISENQNYNTTLAANPSTDPLSLIRALYVSNAAPTVVKAINLDGTLPTDITPAADGGANNGVITIAAGYDSSDTNDYAFFAVKANGGGGNFFAANSGVRAATLNATTNAFTAGNFVTIAPNSDWIVSTNANAAAAVPVTNAAALHWCPGLNRLYIGLQGTNNTGNAGNDVSFFALVIAKSDATVIPLIAPVAGGGDHEFTLGAAAGDNTSNIVGLTRTDAAATSMAILKLDSMKTSTGHHYLIVQGGFGAAADQGNKIFAIPLVDADGDVPGALASITDLAVGTTTFKKQATAVGELFVESSAPAKVGGGVLPIAVSATAVTGMMVVGDTVFASISVGQNAANEPGIYYSQAIFNADGSIGSWTYWAKAVPNQVSGADNEVGSCFTFAVDAITGKIWTVGAAALTTVRVSQWAKDTAANTFAGSVNALLDGPCYSAFNLHQQVVNYGVTNVNRFAFFGGDSKVVAVRTGVSGAAGLTGIEKPTTDWTAAAATATSISTGLDGVGSINCLGWTNQNTGVTDNYLLAGTNKGLYAFAGANGGAGINIGAIITDINATPFTDYTWQKVTKIGNDPVVKIVSMTGTATPVTYVLTHGTQHKLWRITAAGQATLAALDVPAQIELIRTAEKIVGGDTDLPTFFYDIDLTMVTDAATASALLLATDKGLYISTNVGAVAANVAFNRLDLSADTNEIRSLHTPLRTILNQNLRYSTSILRNPANAGWTSRVFSSLGSVNFAKTPAYATPTTYTHVLGGDKLAADNSVLPLANSIKKFYSDGGRRFYIERYLGDDDNGCTLHVLPYYNGTSDYNVTEVFDLADPAIANAYTFYWINEMGAGYLMAGTDDGVITLR